MYYLLRRRQLHFALILKEEQSPVLLATGKQNPLTFDSQKEINSSRSFAEHKPNEKLNKRLTVQRYSWQSFHLVASDFGSECSEILSSMI